ncbi:COR domain-containing protein [Anaerolineales bacterium HSG6]|nr:COR domain-containing protein [Anaerolineales bacterium HSG6]
MNYEKARQKILQAVKMRKTTLDFNWYRLSQLPPEIGLLTNLINLDISGNQLNGLPTEIGLLTNLINLDISGNQLSDLPTEIGLLTNLINLDISGNQLSGLPTEIEELTNLKTLNLSYNQLNWLNSKIGQLTNLIELNLSRNSLGGLPPEIGQLTNLIELNLSRNKLNDLPPEIGQLTNLHQILGLNKRLDVLFRIYKALYSSKKILNLSKNQLSILPLEVTKLTNLTELDLSDNKLSHLPPEINQLTNLVSLNLQWNQLNNLPLEVTRLTNLTELDLSRNRLGKLPKINQLTNLTRLDLHWNQLNNLPLEVTQLTSLTKLDLSRNRLNTLPATISNLTNLINLDLRDNNLTQLLPEISQLINLTHLDLHGNKLSSYPPEVTQLTNLTELDLSQNKLSSLSPKIGELVGLIKLNIRNNQLSSLPSEIGRLKNLTDLHLSGNALNSPPPEIINQGTKAIVQYMAQLLEEDVDRLYEAKLLIIGEPGAGKTTLARKLIDAHALMPPEEETTRGIEIEPWEFSFLPRSKESNAEQALETFQANIWDFGGQQIYHSTHRFFLTHRSLYLLVADSRKENTDFYYWLNIVKLFAEGSPLLIVTNEKDGRFRVINQRQLQGQFEQLKEVFDTNLKSGRGLTELSQSVQYHLTTLPHVGDELPKTWVKVREALEQDERNYISLSEFLEICAKHGFSKLEYKRQLSQYLHDLGICLHYQHDDLLDRWVILKPTWCTDAVYKVLDTRSIAENNGRFNRVNLQKIWREEQYSAMRPELLRMMELFRICYEIPGQSRIYIAPQLLPEAQPDYIWVEKGNLHFHYRYGFMPKGLLSELIVVLHRLIWKQKRVWRTGVVFEAEDRQTGAEVLEFYHRSRIEIRLAGRDKRDLLAIIRHEMNKIHASYPGLEVRELIPCYCETCQQNGQPYFFPYDLLKKRQATGKKTTIECHESGEDINIARLIDDVFGSDKIKVKSAFNQLQQRLMDMSDTDLEFLCLEHFREVMDQFADNMAKDRKIYLLLKHCQQDGYRQLTAALAER